MAPIALFFLLSTAVSAQDWQFPRFSQPDIPGNPGNVQLKCDDDNNCRVNFDEGVNKTLYLAKLNYNGASQVVIKELDQDYLKPFLKSENGGQYITTNTPQDFITTGNMLLTIEVTIGSTIDSLYLFVRDINNQKPILSSEDQVCSVKENNPGPTSCKILLEDIDTVCDDTKVQVFESGSESTEFSPVVTSIKNCDKNINLKVVTPKGLDYETKRLYKLDIIVIDGPFKVSRRLVVEVGDEPDMPPKWTMAKAITLVEETEKEIQLTATGGDLGLDEKLTFDIDVDEDHKNFFDINRETGMLNIKKIDRESLKSNIFYINATATDSVYSTPFQLQFVITDLNDNSPKIDEDPCTLNMTFDEGTIGILNGINIKDMDEGENGTYDVFLEDKSGKGFSNFFIVTPNVGYLQAPFSISVNEPKKFDYENPEMRQFSFELVAKEKVDSSHIDRCEVIVHLRDVNDEPPHFINVEDLNVTENAPDGKLITTLKAIDEDHEDKNNLKYSTSSTTIVRVDPSTGEMRAIGGKFDREMIEKMIIQVTVEDKAKHSVSAQFSLTILDENDTPPNIFLGKGVAEVSEDVSENYVVSDEIRANDLDGKPDLHFHINWDGSSATHQGIEQDISVVKGNFIMNDGCDCKKGDFTACSCLLVAKKLNWKLVDTLYLNITVTDNGTVVNATDDSALLVIRIKDVNDHAPIFKDVEVLEVEENSTSGVQIGIVRAEDNEDSPANSKVTYKLDPRNGTLPNLVKIDEGILTVDEGNTIDYECYQTLYYTVTAIDGDHHPTLDIAINVKDTNDNAPEIISKGDTVSIKEFSNPGNVYRIEAEDLDLTAPFNTLTFDFDDDRNKGVIRSLFDIDNSTGLITSKVELDYLKGPEYEINIIVRDNFLKHDETQSNPAYTKITVKVEDVNNHRPEFQTPKTCEANPMESEKSGSLIVRIQADDLDEKAEYHTVLYSITQIIKVDAVKEPPEDLFVIDENSGEIRNGVDLSGYIGKYNITVLGRNPDTETPQSNSQSFTICIQDINDHSPVITSPNSGFIQLREHQSLHGELIQYTGEKLLPITATDDDMGQNAEIDFSISNKDGGPNEYFTLRDIDTKTTRLELKKTFNISGERQFELVITATDRGEPARSSTTNLIVQVLTVCYPPYFEITKDSTEFKENDRYASYPIKPAMDYDNVFKKGCDGTFYYRQEQNAPVNIQRSSYSCEHYNNDCDEINYNIAGGNDKGNFYIDKNVLRLNEALDYETDGQKIVLNITATNPDGILGESSTLELTVKILDENDNPPEFQRKSFAEAIITGDKRGKVIKRFQALDKDQDEIITYMLLYDTMNASDSLISHVKELEMNSGGELILNFFPDNSMSGYFSFKIAAYDKVQHNDTADVRVYMILDSNRLRFVFDNTKKFVEDSSGKIEDIFSKYLNYNCTVEDILMDSYTQELSRTSVTAHFTDENASLPVDNSVTELLINERAKDIKQEFKKFALNWVDAVAEDKSTDNGEDQSALTQTVLIVVSALLATLVLLLLATFFFKIRSYHRRLEALSETKFGSQDSGLNRVNMNVPNTNQHALEGSNPVWNEELDNEDNISQGSGDSELVGVEDNPEFSPQNHQIERRRGSKNPIFDDIENDKEWSSVEYSPDVNMNEEKNPNFSFGPPTTNVPTTEL